MDEVAVLVHGLWLSGAVMGALRRRLETCGYRTLLFSYPTVRCSVIENAARLQDMVSSLQAPAVHFVGHSMGGLVIRRLFHDFPAQRPGRIVTLGTPHRGSYAAAVFYRRRLGRALLGGAARGCLLGGMPPWDGQRALGVIAGTRGIGLGWLIPGLKGPYDGTVRVDETRLPAAADFIDLRVTHLGMLLSPAVAHQVCIFLRDGCFDRSAAAR